MTKFDEQKYLDLVSSMLKAYGEPWKLDAPSDTPDVLGEPWEGASTVKTVDVMGIVIPTGGFSKLGWTYDMPPLQTLLELLIAPHETENLSQYKGASFQGKRYGIFKMNELRPKTKALLYGAVLKT